MSLPLLMLIPWNSPAPEPPAPNQWAPDPSSLSNMWDVAGVMLDGEITEIINDAFGTDLSLMDLIELLYRFQAGKLTDSQMVQVIQMGTYFARNTLKWTLAPDNLDHWLEAGGLQDPAQIMHYTLIKDQERIIDALVDEHYDVIVDGIKKRLLAPPGAEFPASPVTITGPFGDPIEVNPAETPLPAGGEETLYYDSSTLTTDDSTSDLFNAVNAVHLVSQVQVKSEVLITGEWQVTIVDWQVWFWDSYDWNKEKQSVSIPLKLLDKLPADIAQYRSTIEDALKRNSINLSVLQNLKVMDSQMSQIEGKKIAMPDGSTKQPKAYPIYSNGSWSFDASTYGKDTVLTIPPP
jgi:hypothetical protein